nr:MAG TPA: hypothetical protein [Caudoviricetes sp.]
MYYSKAKHKVNSNANLICYIFCYILILKRI